MLVGALAVAGIAFGYVSTDQPDYAPGSVVTISGGNDANGAPGYVPGNAVHVDVSGPNGWTATCDATVAEDGTWSCQVTLDSDPSVADGTYTYTATSVDKDGNPISENGTFTDPPPPPSYLTGTVSPNPTTTGHSISITGKITSDSAHTSGISSATVKASVYTSSTCSGAHTNLTDATSDASGNYTFSTTAPASAGDYYYGVSSNPSGYAAADPLCLHLVVTADTTGPITSNVQVTPTPTNSAPTVTASVDDSTTGNSNIAAAEYFIDSAGANGTGTAMAASDGSFSSPSEGVTAALSSGVFSGLSQGAHTVYVHGKDAVGNWGATATTTFVKDTVAPETTIDTSPSNPSNDATPSFSFSGTDTGGSGVASFKCKLDAGSFAACTSPDTQGTLSDGSHTFSVEAIDNAGNVDASPASYTWVVDTTPPDTSITANPPDPSNDATPSFSFSGTDTGGSGVASFECKVDSGVFAACTSGDALSTLSDGQHTFYVRAIDNAGNTDQSAASYTWTVDTAPPTVTLDLQAGSDSGKSDSDNITNAASLTYDVTFNESVTGVAAGDFSTSGSGSGTCSVGAPSGSGSAYTVTLSSCSEGAVTLTFAANGATDAASNTGPTSAASADQVTIDRTAPTITHSIPGTPTFGSSPTYVTSATTLRFSVNDNAGGSGIDTCSITVAGATTNPTCTSGNNDYKLDSTLFGSTPADGSYTNTADANDVAGNPATEDSFSVTLDNTAPSSSVTAPSASSFVGGNSVSVTATADDGTGSGVKSVQFQSKAHAAATWNDIGSADTSSPYSATWDTTSLTDGSYDLRVVATDNLDNSMPSDIVTVTVDNTPPTITLTVTKHGSAVAATADGTTGWYNIATSGTGGIDLTATATDGANVASLTCKDGATTIINLTGSSTSLSNSSPVVLGDGQHNISCTAADGVGNSGASSSSTGYDAGPPSMAKATYKVDQTAPTISHTVGTPQSGSSPVFVTSATDLTFTVSDAAGGSGIDTCTITVTDPSSNTFNPACASGTNTYNLNATLLGPNPADGAYGNTADATDKAGNSATENSFSVTLDNSAPAIAITTPPSANSASPTIYSYGSVPNADYSCDDGTGSGLAATGGCVGKVGTTTVNSGDALPDGIGAHTLAVTSKDKLGNTQTVSHYYLVQAVTSVAYVNQSIVGLGSPLQMIAQLSVNPSTATSCLNNRSVTFTVYDSGSTQVATATATTNSSGQASATVPTTGTGWTEGTYSVTITVTGTTNCTAATDSNGAVLVTAPGEDANGGGWYKATAPGVNPPRVNFGFEIRQVPKTSPVQYKGQILLINTNRWRLKGTLNSYAKVTSGTVNSNACSTTSPCAQANGTGTLYWWDWTQNGGLGAWVQAATNVPFTISLTDSGSGKKSTDSMGITIVYGVQSGQPNPLPNGLPVSLMGGNITIS